VCAPRRARNSLAREGGAERGWRRRGRLSCGPALWPLALMAPCRGALLRNTTHHALHMAAGRARREGSSSREAEGAGGPLRSGRRVSRACGRAAMRCACLAVARATSTAAEAQKRRRAANVVLLCQRSAAAAASSLPPLERARRSVWLSPRYHHLRPHIPQGSLPLITPAATPLLWRAHHPLCGCRPALPALCAHPPLVRAPP
jgi:hypothetical protein